MNFPNKLIILAALVYFLLSLVLFNTVYKTTKAVIDELFHLRQGHAYCQLNFSGWDPKITTLPGLYLYSTIFCNFFSDCSIYCLRLSNLVISVYNIFLINSIKQLLEPKISEGKCVATAVNLSLLPPLYFFSHVYYTDIPGITCVLGIYYYGMKRKFIVASIFGVAAILMRQTNIIYVALTTGVIVIGHIFNGLYRSSNKDLLSISEQDLKKCFRGKWQSYNLLRCFKQFPFIEIGFYINIGLAFLLFVYLNGGIVVGDKKAHSATLHIPQIFYFSLFTLVFAWPHCIKLIKPFLLNSLKNYLALIICTILFCFIVNKNTIVHPYLLADNRHFVFYIWKRFFAVSIFRYLVVPVYVFGFYCIWKLCYNPNDIRFTILFIPVTILVLVLQRLLEFRYFLVPFVLLRVQFSNVSKTVLVFEFLTYIIINTCTFYVFFTKEIKWVDFDDIQRIIW